jgi:hypothetical protein
MPRPLASLVLAAAGVAIVASAAWAAADLRRMAKADADMTEPSSVEVAVRVETAAGAGAALRWSEPPR